MTPHKSLLSVRLSIQQHRLRSDAETPPPHRRTARFLLTAACGLLLAAASPSGVHGLSDSSAASDTLRVTLSAPEGGTVAEGTTGHFVVAVAGSTAAGAVKVRYSVSGTAVAGEDYTALSGEATAAQGENVARIALEALEDGILDKGETVVLTLTGATGPGTLVVDQTAATATIADNGSVRISLTAVPDTIGEGSAWSSTMTMSTPVADRVSVRWWTSDGTALAGRDYAAADEVVSFRPGETSKRIEVQTLKDDNTEAVEVFYVSLGLPYSSARTETEAAVTVDPKPQSAFIECSVRFPPDIRTVFRLNEPVSSGTVIGTVAADTHSLAVYSLGGGRNKFKINVLTGEISTTAALSQGSYHLTVSVLDDCGGSASVNVIVVVNGAPDTVNSIPDNTIEKDESDSADVSSYFSDPENGALTYTASSSEPSVVGVSVSGSKVTYEGLKAGSATVTVRATDSGDLYAEQPFTVTVTPRNVPPVANAGDDQTVDEGDRVDLDGTASTDSDGTIVEWAWTDPLPLTDDDTSTPHFTAPTTGATKSYTFTLTVTDNDGATDSDDVTITVEANDPPDANAGDDQTVEEGDRVDLDGTGSSDSDGTIVKWEWTGPLTLTDGDTSTPYFAAPTTGATKSYTFTLTVTDNDGATDSDDVTITVEANEPPVADAGPDQTVEEGDRVDLDGTGSSDSDGTIEDWEWTGPVTLTDADTSTPYFTAPTTGATKSYTFTLTVTDNDGATDSDDVTITVEANEPPVADAGPDQTVEEGDRVDLDGTGSSDSDGTIVGWEWTGPLTLTDGDTSTPYFAAPTTGATKSYTFTLTVTDNNGATDSDDVTITVEANEPPDADAGPDQTVEEGDRVDLDGTGSSDSDGTIVGWEWTGPLTLTDGDTSTPYFAAPTTGATKSYTFTLTVTDNNGATDSDDVTITVEANEPPDADAGPDQTVEEGDRVDLDGTGSSDSDGTIVKWEWTGPLALTDGGTSTPYFTAPTTGATKSYTFTLTVTDDDGATDSDRVRVTVEPTRNCEITVRDAGLSVAENAGVGTAVSREVGVTASDCGTLRYALSGTGSGDFSVSAASANDDAAKIRVKRALNHEGRDAYDLTLTVSWGSVSETGDLDISVTDVNEPPKPSGTIGRQTVRVGRPGSLSVTGYFTDEDAGDRLTFTSESSATGKLTVSGSGSPVTLTGVAAGSATVTVTARDRGGLTATQTFPVTVEPAPVPCGITVSDGSLSVPEDAGVGAGVAGEVTVIRTGNCGTLSYALSGTGAADFSVAAAGVSDDDGKIKVRRTLNHEGRDAYDLTLTVSEVGGAATGAGDVDISVTDVNEAPKPSGAIVTQKVRIGRPGSVDVTGYFTDEDAGDRLTFASKSSATGKLTVNASGSPVTLTGVAVGSAAVTVTARDRGGLTATQTFSVTVDPAPTKPCGITVSDGSLSVPEDAGVGAGVDGKVGVTTTGDCGTLGYSLSGTGAADFTAAAAGSSDDDAKIGVAKALDHETRASYALTLTVSWGSVSDEGEVGISVTDVNDAPEVVSAIPALTLNSGDSKVVDVSSRFRDPDGDALTYEASSSTEAAATVAVSGSGVTVTGVSPGESRVTVTARDGRGGSVSQDFTVTVENQAPEVVSAIPALTVAAGSSKAVDVSAHFRDPNGATRSPTRRSRRRRLRRRSL